jgi:hypothetical protein
MALLLTTKKSIFSMHLYKKGYHPKMKNYPAILEGWVISILPAGKENNPKTSSEPISFIKAD